jgi:hypothetical protein
MILFIFPSRERPVKCFAAIDNIISMIGEGIDYKIQLTLDLDDATMSNQEVRDRINSYGENVKAYWGTSTGKVFAINRDMEFSGEWDILCLHSDDFLFIKLDFGKDILKAFEGFSGLVHFPDGFQNERLITYPMMSREYFNLFGYIYHKDYYSVYGDDEQMAVAKKLGRYKYVPTSIFLHQHYLAGYGAPDELSKKEDSPEMYEKDKATFLRRKELNFDL